MNAYINNLPKQGIGLGWSGFCDAVAHFHHSVTKRETPHSVKKVTTEVGRPKPTLVYYCHTFEGPNCMAMLHTALASVLVLGMRTLSKIEIIGLVSRKKLLCGNADPSVVL